MRYGRLRVLKSHDPFTFESDFREGSRIQTRFYKEGKGSLEDYTARAKELWKEVVKANDAVTSGKSKDGKTVVTNERAFGRAVASIRRVVKESGGTFRVTKKGNIMVNGKSLTNIRGNKQAGGRARNIRSGNVLNLYTPGGQGYRHGNRPASTEESRARNTASKRKSRATAKAKLKSKSRKK